MPLKLEAGEFCELERSLSSLATQIDFEAHWPSEQLRACGRAGVYRWFAPKSMGGWAWSDEDQTAGYLQLSRCCLTTAFIITQRTAAFTRILASPNTTAQERWLPNLIDGQFFATVGISHLTTSRQHLGTPVLRATPIDGERFELHGYTPWVTGAAYADCLVVGGSLADGRQILACIDKELPGISAGSGRELLGLLASKTDQVQFEHVVIHRDDVLFGPADSVLQQGKASGTGGTQTSTLALGLACRAIDHLKTESIQRSELAATTEKLEQDWQRLWTDLLSQAKGIPKCSNEQVRQRANSIVLRATQSALTASKGAGYLADHPTARWCREALFFLVWSCPRNVSQANLCEFAGLSIDH